MPTANVLSYAEIFQAGLDQQFLEISTTTWMEANSGLVRYNGGNTVQIPKLTVEGLGTYNRATGFPDGAATLVWEPRTLTQDRGKEFNLDAQDNDETAFAANAPVILSEFQRTKVVPEVDAYRYSKVFSLSNQALKTGAYTPAVGTVFSQLKGDIKTIQNVIGEGEPLVIAISYDAADLLDRSTEFDRAVSMIELDMGGIMTKVRALDGIPLVRVPSARFKSDFAFSATDGFSATATAMSLNWVIAARSSLIAVVKTDKVRIFSPDTNQEMDAWKIQVRKYHDLWILDNKFDSIFVSYTAIAAPALSATVAAGVGTGNTKFTATAGSGNTLAYKLNVGAGSTLTTGVLFNSIPTGLTAYTSGANIAAAATDVLDMYELDATGHVVKFLSFDLGAGQIA